MTPLRLALAAAALAVAVLLFFVFRPEEEDVAMPTTTAVITAPPTVESRQTTARWRIADTSRLARLRVAKDTIVTLTVDLDVQDEVHVHGYDIKTPITPQTPARLEFEADTTGRFEVELENEHRQIGELTVVP